MIDLGIDLDGFDDDEPPRPPAYGQPIPTALPGGGHTVPLADLQRAGFDTLDTQEQHRLLRAMLDDRGPMAGIPPGLLSPIVQRTLVRGVDFPDVPDVIIGSGGGGRNHDVAPGGAGGGLYSYGRPWLGIAPAADGIDPDVDEALGGDA